jgi:hypothetical protein
VVRACELLGAPVPVEVLDPIKRVGLPAGAEGGLVREPTLLLTPSLDGRETTYFEWQGAGLYRPTLSRGAMFGGAQAFRALHLGFDLQSLFLRLDPAESPQRAAEQAGSLRVEIRGGEHAVAVDFGLAADGTLRAGRRAEAPGEGSAAEIGQICFARVVELGLPFAALGLAPGSRVAVAVHVRRGQVAVERLPRAGYVAFTVPDEDFERVHWRV